MNRDSFNHTIILFQVLICFSWNRPACSVLTNHPKILAVYNSQGLFFRYTTFPVGVSRGFCFTSFYGTHSDGGASFNINAHFGKGESQAQAVF